VRLRQGLSRPRQSFGQLRWFHPRSLVRHASMETENLQRVCTNFVTTSPQPEAHLERALVQAQRCLEAAGELEERGADSWIAGAVLHRLAFDVSWAVLAEQDDELREEGCSSTVEE